MKKIAYMILSAVVLAMGFTSCVQEDGPGVPSLKKMHLQSTEYTIDFRTGATDNLPAEDEQLILRWIDVTNATYELYFTNTRAEGDTKKALSNQQVPGDLSTLSTTIAYSQILEYIAEQNIWEDIMETQKDAEGKDITVEFQRAVVNINVKGTPIDLSHTALDPEGSVVYAAVTLYRDKQ